MSQDAESIGEPIPPQPVAPDDLWARMMADVRARFPQVSEGAAFCILKLEMNPDVRLRDFQSEADLHAIKLNGRSFHSARVALGLEAPTVRRVRAVDAVPAPRIDVAPIEVGSTAGASAVRTDDDESPVIAALRQFEARSADELERLRTALREVLAIVDTALDG